jgi:hypothetical protein
MGADFGSLRLRLLVTARRAPRNFSNSGFFMFAFRDAVRYIGSRQCYGLRATPRYRVLQAAFKM